MLEHAEALTIEYAMLPSRGHILCAVSGGADSMCLLHWLHVQAKDRGFFLSAAHFNHHLRGAESDRDADFVEDWCAHQDIPFFLGSGDVIAHAQAEGLGVEEAARILRYAFLEDVARQAGATSIATAHNTDDNAETLLLHLVRGSGLQGLTGIPPRRGNLIRPLLTTSRAEILSYLEAHGLPHVEDSTNADTIYARNNLRHQVLPLLRELNPQLNDTLGRTVAYLRADNDYLNAQAFPILRESRPMGGGLVVPAALIARQPNPIAVRMVRHLFLRLDVQQFRSAHLLSVVDLARSSAPSGQVDLPHGLTAQRLYEGLYLGPLEIFSPQPRVALNPEEPRVVVLGPWRIALRPCICPEHHPTHPSQAFLSPAALQGEATLRPRRIGDEITLPGRSRKRLKKLLIDEKVPRPLRDSIPVLCDENSVLYLPGFGPDAPHLAVPGEPAWEVTATSLFWKEG